MGSSLALTNKTSRRGRASSAPRSGKWTHLLGRKHHQPPPERRGTAWSRDLRDRPSPKNLGRALESVSLEKPCFISTDPESTRPAPGTGQRLICYTFLPPLWPQRGHKLVSKLEWEDRGAKICIHHNLRVFDKLLEWTQLNWCCVLWLKVTVVNCRNIWACWCFYLKVGRVFPFNLL